MHSLPPAGRTTAAGFQVSIIPWGTLDELLRKPFLLNPVHNYNPAASDEGLILLKTSLLQFREFLITGVR
jgi:hypothetical protein